MGSTNAATNGVVTIAGTKLPISEAFGQAWFWMLAFLIFWDAVELWIRYRNFKFVFTGPFFLYFLFHLLIASLAGLLLQNTIATPWLLAVVAATSTETVLSNTNIKLGEASLLPIVELFKALRIAMQEQLKKMADAVLRQLHGRLSRVKLAVLEREVINQLIQLETPVAEIQTRLSTLKGTPNITEDTIRSKLAWDLLGTNDVYVRKQIKGWLKE